MKRLKLFLSACALMISAIAYAQTDVTSTYITNAGFDESSDFQTSIAVDGSAHRYDVTGWTSEGGTQYTSGGAIGIGNGKINNADVPSTNAEGTATGGVLAIQAAWASNVFYKQEVTLPAGNYTMTFKVNNVGQNAQFEKDPVMFSFTTNDGSSFSGNVHSYPVNTWTTQTITFALASETTGTIKIGYKATNTGSGNTPKLVVDYVKAMYNNNYTATLQSAIDRATILNARASDDDLASAITTAQSVLNAADNTVAYQSTIDDAVTTLRSAISTAAAKVVLLEGENITFMFENADFESGTPVTVGITTYDYDAATNGTHYSRMQVVEGWTIAANGNAKSAGIYEFGQNPFLGSSGTQYQAPASGSATGEEKALGIVAVWSSSAQYKQNCTLPAGSYIIEVPVYNTAGTTAFNKNLIGFVENGGTEHLATAKTYATGSWITEKIIFELENETAGYLSLGYTAANAGSGGMPHLFIDGVKVTYTSPIAAAYQKYQDALTAAQAAIANSDYDNVTGDERTDLQSAIDATPATTKEGYNDAADALDAARETFTSAKANYDAFVAAKATVVPDLTYAAAAKKTALEEAVAAIASNSAEAATKAAAITTALRAYYESHALAEKVEGAVNMTSVITNANNPTNNDGWTWTGNKNTPASNEPWTDADGTNTHSYFDGGDWNASSWTTTMSQTISIPAGTYLLTAKGRAAANTTLTMAVGEVNVALPHVGSVGNVFDRGWGDASVEFTTDGNDVTILVTASTEIIHEWFSISDFRLMQLSLNTSVYADADDYAALNDAISEAEAKTLGFEDGEYAPYKNVAALEALAAAKAIDQTAELTNFKTNVQAATAALTDATWTANEGVVDAIYNGWFETPAEGQNYPDGWTRTNAWGQMQDSEIGQAYYNQPGSLQYGNQGVYTMPLEENAQYLLTFKYRSHENNSNKGMTVSVLNENNEGLAAVTFSGNGSTSKWKTVNVMFTTGAAGNYVLTLANDGNTWMTDVRLLANTTSFYLHEDEDYEGIKVDEEYWYADEAYYYEVDLFRTFKADTWNTFVVPFDLSNEELKAAFGDDVAVAEFSDEADGDNVKVNFNTMDTPAITANKPVLLKVSAESAENDYVTFNNKFIKEGDAKVAGTYVDFVGTYAASTTITAGNYFINGNDLWKSAGETIIKGTRAYIDARGNQDARINLFIDGEGVETTGINEVIGKMSEVRDGSFYDLQGRKVANPSRGLYIINGKKVVIK